MRNLRSVSSFHLPALLVLLAACVLTCPGWARAQQSAWLQDPDGLIAFARSNADFWAATYDPDRGGFYTNVGREGQVLSSRGTNKDVLTQSRNAYGMIRAFQMTGDETYLEYARGALDFMYDHGWDHTYGGWRNNISSLGIPYNIQQDKTAFLHHYALLGPMAMMEATVGVEVDSVWFHRGLEYNNTVLWDARPGHEGYYDRVDWRSQNPTGKSFNATVDALTTHALQESQMYGGQNRDRLELLAQNILDRFLPTMADNAIGFAEKYDSDWKVLSNERLSIMGHVLKTAWVLERLDAVFRIDAARPNGGGAAELFGRALTDASDVLFEHVLERGYDHEFGGPYKDYDRVTGEMQLWGLADTTKAWWQMQQAVMAGMTNRDHDDGYRIADETLDFFEDFFVDDVYGEVYADRTRRGGAIPQWGDHKGDGFKAGYHSTELAWYTFLYDAWIGGHAITLYWRAWPVSRDTEKVFAPWEDGGRNMGILDVTLDGQSIGRPGSFEDAWIIPAGTEGVLAVSFGFGPGPVATEGAATLPAAPTLTAYPNPFTDYLTIEWNEGPVNVVFTDVLGRIVLQATLPPGQPGRIHTSSLPPGVYVVTVAGATGRRSMPVVRLP
ncbi:MAG: AGE family epimerase/isomerase [Rhodothermales bacterium]